MSTPQDDPDRADPTKQSGRPFQVMAMLALIVGALVVMLVIGMVVL